MVVNTTGWRWGGGGGGGFLWFTCLCNNVKPHLSSETQNDIGKEESVGVTYKIIGGAVNYLFPVP